MLAQPLRCWPNIKTSSFQRVVFVGWVRQDQPGVQSVVLGWWMGGEHDTCPSGGWVPGQCLICCPNIQKVFGQRGAHLEISVPRKPVSADRRSWGNGGPTYKTSARLCPKHHVDVGAHQTVPWQYYLLLAQFLNKANESDVSRLLAGW